MQRTFVSKNNETVNITVELKFAGKNLSRSLGSGNHDFVDKTKDGYWILLKSSVSDSNVLDIVRSAINEKLGTYPYVLPETHVSHWLQLSWDGSINFSEQELLYYLGSEVENSEIISKKPPEPPRIAEPAQNLTPSTYSASSTGGGYPGSSSSYGYSPTPPSKKRHTGRNVAIAATVLIILLILAAFGSYFVTPSGNSSTTSGNPPTSVNTVSRNSYTSAGTIASSDQILAFQPSNPSFNNGSANLSYPNDYSILANYTLSLINADRAASSLSPVSLSTIESGQQHADSMDYYGTFSHWDVQGYKPYMRYTLLGGHGRVSENAAFNYCIDSSDVESTSTVTPVTCTLQTVENAINSAEWNMMYNDAACCDNGHRENILGSMHTAVSIGISYDVASQIVFLVEDFENNYLQFSTLLFSGNTVTMQGSLTNRVDLTPWKSNGYSGAAFSIYYDPLPQAIPASSLPTVGCLSSYSSCAMYQQCHSLNELNETSACTYWGAYDSGTFLGEAFGPCGSGYTCSSQLQGGGTAIYANIWSVSPSSFDTQLSLSTLIQQYGNGVYTLYLYPNGANDSIMSYSLFVG